MLWTLTMERQKITAIVTGAISLALGIFYLIVVQILDSREMIPAPVGMALLNALNQIL